MRNKIITTTGILLCTLTPYLHAGVVYKCIDNGKVVYSNDSSSHKNCKKTDLADPKKMPVVKSHNKAVTPESIARNQMLTSQARNDRKRQERQEEILLLEREINNEKEKLKTVKTMRANAGNDPEQIQKLDDLEKESQDIIERNKNKIQKLKNTKETEYPVEIDLNEIANYFNQSQGNATGINEIIDLVPNSLPLNTHP